MHAIFSFVITRQHVMHAEKEWHGSFICVITTISAVLPQKWGWNSW